MRFKTIFVHIPKTAGQSISQVFLSQHGLAWKDREALLLRPNSDSRLGPVRLAHLYAREYVERGHVDYGTFAAFFKFSVVRNPYDRLISEYRYRHQMGDRSFLSFLTATDDHPCSGLARHAAPQVNFVQDAAGAIIVDRIIRFENLRTDIEPLFYRIFGHEAALPHVNKSSAAPVDRQTIGDDVRRAIYRRYEIDFDTFRYPSTTR